MTKTSDAIERRVNMKSVEKDIKEILTILKGDTNEIGLCKRVRKNEDDILQIKTTWSVIVVFCSGLASYFTRKL